MDAAEYEAQVPAGLRRDRLVIPRVAVALAEAGWTQWMPVQRAVLPAAIKGRNIVASAETGTGKTGAFGVPLVMRARELIHARRTSAARAPAPAAASARPVGLVLVPTRELAEQVSAHLRVFAKHSEVTVGTLSGQGKPALTKEAVGADILVATPGRLAALLEPGSEAPAVHLGDVGVFVLDEADKMLDLGLFPDVHRIYREVPRPSRREGTAGAQVMLFSATLVAGVWDLILRLAPRHALFNLNKALSVSRTVDHLLYPVSSRRKAALLVYLLRRKGPMRDARVLVFVRTQQRADRLAVLLREEGFAAEAVHADRSPTQRRDVVTAFMDQSLRVLVATDVMARGMDFPELDWLINYDAPVRPEDYVHRVGRTGRAGRKGTAISFVARDPIVITLGMRRAEINERHMVRAVEQFLDKRIRVAKVPGPWRDEVDVEAMMEARRKSREEAEALLDRKLEAEARARQAGSTWNPVERMLERKRRLGHSTPDLRSFPEGRFESLVKRFETKRFTKTSSYRRDPESAKKLRRALVKKGVIRKVG
jgi:ATP-dependent RNA helicase RhlE